jgi:hypothetical protein
VLCQFHLRRGYLENQRHFGTELWKIKACFQRMLLDGEALNVEPAVGPCHFQLCLVVAELAGKPGTTLLQSSVLSPLIAFLKAGTGVPAILSFTEPRKFQLVKYSVFRSGPPKAMFVVCGWPWTFRPSFLPRG